MAQKEELTFLCYEGHSEETVEQERRRAVNSVLRAYEVFCLSDDVRLGGLAGLLRPPDEAAPLQRLAVAGQIVLRPGGLLQGVYMKVFSNS